MIKKKKKEPEKPLYRVFIKATNQPAYLPAGKGLLKEEAERLSKILKKETEISCVWEPEPEEE
jgi:hypothetical protein